MTTAHIGDTADPILHAVERGWRVFPIAPGTKDKPLVRWREAATNDRAAVVAEFAGRTLNYGIACGESGLVVIDEDSPGAFERWCAARGIGFPPPTYTVHTGKGAHRYFTAPPDVAINNRAMIDGFALDVRGDGGYVLGAGSIHPSGAVYTVVQDLDPAPLPVEVTEALRPRTRPEAQLANTLPPASVYPPPYELPERIDVGQRDDTLFRYASSCRARGLSEAEAMLAMEHNAYPRVAQPPGDGYLLADALAKVANVYATYPPPPSRIVGPPTTPDEFEVAVEADAVKLRIRNAARVKVAAEEAARLPVQPLGVVTLAEVLALPLEPAYRVDSLIPAEAGTLVVAQRKTGKTTLTLNLARSLLSGEPFLGLGVRPLSGTVAVLNFEVSERQLGRWAAEHGIDDSRMILVNLRGRSNPLARPAERDRLAAELRAREVEAVIVDPFGRAYSGDNQNDAGQVGAWLSDLDRLAREGVGANDVILTAHAGWNGERTRGASALEDWADSVITMTRDAEDESARYLRAIGRDVELEEDRLVFDPVTRTLTLAGTGSRRQATIARKLANLADEVVAIVTTEQGIQATQVTHRLRDRGVTFQKGDESKAATAAVRDGRLRVETGRRNARLYYLADARVSPSLPELPHGDIGSVPTPPIRGGETPGVTDGPVSPAGLVRSIARVSQVVTIVQTAEVTVAWPARGPAFARDPESGKPLCTVCAEPTGAVYQDVGPRCPRHDPIVWSADGDAA